MSLKIGIVACSSEGAALCYQTVCARAPALMGEHAHPEIALHGLSLADYVTCLEAGDRQGVADLMLTSAARLQRAGADFLVCPDNTIHSVFDLVERQSPLPWLHIAEVVADDAERQGFRKVGLLGTRWLVESDVYPERFEPRGIAWLRPTPEEVAEVDRIIMKELVNGQQHLESVRYFQHLIGELKQRGCDAVLLGCTEIPLIINEGNSVLPILDSTRLLASAALDRAVGLS